MFPRSLKDQKCCSCIALHRILRAEHDEPKKMVCRAKASRATVKCSVCKSGLTAVPSEIFRVKGCMSPQPIYSVENFIAVAKMLTPHPLPFFFFILFHLFFELHNLGKTTEWDIAKNSCLILLHFWLFIISRDSWCFVWHYYTHSLLFSLTSIDENTNVHHHSWVFALAIRERGVPVSRKPISAREKLVVWGLTHLCW